MKYVLSYETNAESLPLARLHVPAHRARIDEFAARGTLLMVGPFADPADGALGIFTTRAAAEEFVAGDPFVLCGLVKTCTIREWNEILVK
jgi:uncharacterized protein YciI